MGAELEEQLNSRLAAVVRQAREERGLTAAALASSSGVSRAMISRIESGDANPTAALLARLSGALRLTLSELIGRAEEHADSVSRRADQPVWIDPATGYRRRAVSSTASTRTQLVEVDLPAGATVEFGADAYRFIEQQIWVLDGTLAFAEGTRSHRLEIGDCISLGSPQDCVFHNPGTDACRYLVVVTRRG